MRPDCRFLTLSLVALLASASNLAAQSCSAGTGVQPRPAATVSAASLRVSAKAWQHFERARAAADAHRMDIFERESGYALAASPQFAGMYVLRAATQVKAGQYAEAADSIAAARAVEPDPPLAEVVLASALTGMRRYNDAVAALEGGRGTDGGSWAWLYERSRAEIGRRDAAAALHWSELAAGAAPVGCASAHLLRANALELGSRHGEALEEMQAYLLADPTSPRHAEVERIMANIRAAMPQPQTAMLADSR